MASKRKCLEEAEEERQPDVADATARLKALNTGRHVDAASRTQMLLRFGQRLQARRSKRQSQGPAAAPAGQCLQCQAVGREAAVCAHCTGPMCAGCARSCCRCCRVFCATCTMLDYTAQETQSVCFDCSG